MAIFDRKLLKKIITSTSPLHSDKAIVNPELIAYFRVNTTKEEGFLSSEEKTTLSYSSTQCRVDVTIPVDKADDMNDDFISIVDLKKMVTKLPTKVTSVEVTPERGDIIITGGKTSYRSTGAGREDALAYKEEAKVDWTSFTVSPAAFFSALRRVEHAQSKGDLRSYLEGVCLHLIGHDKVNLVATDGHRLARSTVSVGNASDFRDPDLSKLNCDNANVILPTTIVSTLLALEKNMGSELNIPGKDIKVRLFNQNGRSGVIVEGNNFKVLSRGVDGNYPEYRRVIPDKQIAGFNVNKSELSEAIAMVASMSDEKDTRAVVEFTDDSLTVSGIKGNPVSTAVGDFTSWFGEGQEHEADIGFFARYMQQAIAVTEGDALNVALGDNTGCVLVMTEDTKLSSNLELVMQNSTR